MRLRIYDKASKQRVEGPWIRVELVARRKRADGLAAVYKRLNEDPEGVRAELAGILRGYLEFKEAGRHHDKDRWSPAEWWLRFLENAEKARLVLREHVRSVEDIERWIDVQVTPSLAILKLVRGEEVMWAWLDDRVEAARSRLGPRHRAILAAALRDLDAAEENSG
jgi:hypothetical protein